MHRISIWTLVWTLVGWFGCGTPAENERIEADEQVEQTVGNEMMEIGDNPDDMDFDDPAAYPEAEMEAEPYPE